MYLEDFSQLRGFYASRGWAARVPGAKHILTKPLHAKMAPRVDLEGVDDLLLSSPIVSIGAIAPLGGALIAIGLTVERAMAVTTNERWEAQANEKGPVFKLLELTTLAIYWNCLRPAARTARRSPTP